METEGVFHSGLERNAFKACLEKHGFKEVHFVTAHTISGEEKDFPVFLALAVKGPGSLSSNPAGITTMPNSGTHLARGRFIPFCSQYSPPPTMKFYFSPGNISNITN